jgi:hypothetical protein
MGSKLLPFITPESRRTLDGSPIIAAIPGVNFAAANLINQVEVRHQFGHNPTAGTSEEDIWFNGGMLTWLTTAVALDVVSTSTDDDGSPAGTGAHKVMIEGLDSSFDEISEEVTLDGTTLVTTSATFIRVNKAYVTECGTYASPWNVGDITIRATGGGAFQANIEALKGVTQKSHFTVPNGKTCLITRFAVSIDSAQTSRLSFYKRVNADDVATPFSAREIIHDAVGVSGGPYEETFTAPTNIPAKSDLWWTSDAGVANVALSIEYDMVLTTLV